MKVSKTTGSNCMKFSGMICHHLRTTWLDFGSDQVKGQGQGHKRSKTYFGHNALSFHLFHMKPTPKGSLFNSLSSDGSKVKVKVTKRSKTYFAHNKLHFRPIHMKPTSKCSLFNSLSFDRSKVKVRIRSKAYFGHNMFSLRPIHMKPTPKCSLFNYYPLIGQRSRSRSEKGQKHILVITHSVFVRFIWNQRQNAHFSIPYHLIGQRSRSRLLKGQKHILVITRSFSSDSYETNAKMFTFQFPILWYGDKCGVGEGMCSTEATRSGQGKGGTRGAEDPQENWNTSNFDKI